MNVDTILRGIREDVTAGFSSIVSFDCPGGIAWVEIMGPKGMRPAGEHLVAPVPTVRLWPPGGGSSPIAIAAASRSFPASLDALAERARPFLVEEWPQFVAMLATIREAAGGIRFRLPSVGDRVTSTGRPTAEAWASALSLADIEIAFQKAVA